MKKILLTLLLALGLILNGCIPTTDTVVDPVVETQAPPTGSGNPTATPRYLSDLYQLRMFTGGDGWATTLDKSKVFFTNNFGEHFYDVTPEEYTALGAAGSPFAYFANSQTAWLCSSTPEGSGKLFLTGDRGTTWTNIDLDFPCGMMAFPTLQVGYMLASEDVGMGSQYMSLHKSEDGGLTWSEVFKHDPATPQADGLPTGGIKAQFVVLDENVLLVGGSTPVPGLLYLYRSDNGGTSWFETNCQGLPNAEEAELGTSNIVRINATTAFIAVQSFLPDQAQLPTHFCKTTDGGESWTYLSTLDEVAFSDFGTADTGVAYANGKMYQTTDGGDTWVDVSVGLPPAVTPVAVDMVSDIYGYLTASITPDTLEQNRIYMTVEGGKLWKVMPGTVIGR